MGHPTRGLNDPPAVNGAGLTQEAIKAFASSYSRRTGTHCEVQPWPGGGAESHDADAILLIRKNRTRFRVLLEATEVFQGPIMRFGSSSERFLKSLRALEQDVVRLLPSDCSLTIYWRESARQMLDRPARDGVQRQVHQHTTPGSHGPVPRREPKWISPRRRRRGVQRVAALGSHDCYGEEHRP